MKEEIESIISDTLNKLYGLKLEVQLDRCDEKFGDYSTNIAMRAASKVGKKSQELAEELSKELRVTLSDYAKDVSPVAPGFINLTLLDSVLWKLAQDTNALIYENKVVVTEYSDPNPFKVLHAGHLYTSIVGDSIAKLFEVAGAKVHRVNYGGDVGLHVAITLWAILFDETDGHIEQTEDAWTKINSCSNKTLDEKATWLTEHYVKGNEAYEAESPSNKEEVAALNKQVYLIIANDDHDSPLAKIYWLCREWSYDYFNSFYDRLGCNFEKYYPESQTSEIGLKIVKDHIGSVFTESDKAIVFKGENYGLHTRVFITSQGLPTYETKDIGLIMLKWHDYHFDKSVIVTANEQQQYMAVVLCAIRQFDPELAKLAERTTHITHGIVRLAGGVKMSSRRGNILRATDVLDAASEAYKAISDSGDDRVTIGAVKYAFLKQHIGGDIIYDPVESVSLKGNSGPYLQYAYARAMSILAKSPKGEAEISELEPEERSLLRKISEYPEVVNLSISELAPHQICTFLYELAQTFNYFYESNRVLGDKREIVRRKLIKMYSETLKKGLELLNIPVIDRM